MELNTAQGFQDMHVIDTISDSLYISTRGFYMMHLLGPDKRIYILSGYGNMSCIASPDSLGQACSVHQRMQGFPQQVVWGGLPTYPNFRLGRLVGSGCDTILYTAMPGEGDRSFTVYPNPASTTIHIAINGPAIGVGQYVSVLDLQGRVLVSPAWFGTDTDIDIGSLSNGIYLIRVESDSGGVAYRKLVVNK